MEMSAINLRSDLKKLSDVELAERLESALLSLPKKNIASEPDLSLDLVLQFGTLASTVLRRGLGASNSGNIFVDLLIPLAWSMMNVKTDHQLVCEIRDLMDEAERRVALRKRTAKA